MGRSIDFSASAPALVDDQRRPDGTGWVVMADPEGNEFCIERSDAERLELGRAAWAARSPRSVS